jgi:hypothetical protein
MDSFIGNSKYLQLVYRKQFSQPEYVIIFHIAKSYTMSEILGRQTPTAVALEYTVQYSVHIHRDHNITGGGRSYSNAS